MTGMTSMTIHSGLLPLSRMASTSLSRLMRSLIFCLLLVLLQVLAQLVGQLVQVQLLQQLADGLGPHLGLEVVAVLLDGRAVLLLGEELLALQRRVAGVDRPRSPGSR